MADRYNRTKIIGIGVIVWSFFTAVSGMAKNFVTLAIPRLFIGIGESAMTPTTMSILSDRYDIKRLGFAAGFYYMGGMIRGIAKQMGINIRFSGDWDSDGDTKDNSFDDLVHVEIKE